MFVRQRRYDALQACHLASSDQLDHALAAVERLTVELTRVNERYDRVVQQVMRLKKRGDDLEREPRAKVVKASEDPETRIVRLAERGDAIEQLIGDLRAEDPGLSESDARTHAVELLREAGVVGV